MIFIALICLSRTQIKNLLANNINAKINDSYMGSHIYKIYSLVVIVNCNINNSIRLEIIVVFAFGPFLS